MVYKWYANWVIICYRSHLLREPETTIENGASQQELSSSNHELAGITLVSGRVSVFGWEKRDGMMGVDFRVEG